MKATLLLELGRLINTVPESVRNGGVGKVRDWKEKRAQAAKVAAGQRSSVSQINSALNVMRSFGK